VHKLIIFFFLVFIGCRPNANFITTNAKKAYRGSLYPFKYDEKWGYADFHGNTIIEPQFEDASLFQFGLASVKLNGLYGYISSTGHWKIKPRFLIAGPFTYRTNESQVIDGKSERILTALVSDGDRKIYIDEEGKIKDQIISSGIFNCMPFVPQVEKFSVKNSDETYELTFQYWSVLNDTTGFKVIDTTDLKLDTIIEYKKGRALLKKDSKYAIYNTDRSGPFNINTCKPHLIPIDSTYVITLDSLGFIYDDVKFKKMLDQILIPLIYKKRGRWGIPGGSKSIVPFIYYDLEYDRDFRNSYKVEFEIGKYGYISLVFDSQDRSNYVVVEHFKRSKMN